MIVCVLLTGIALKGLEALSHAAVYHSFIPALLSQSYTSKLSNMSDQSRETHYDHILLNLVSPKRSADREADLLLIAFMCT